MKTASPTRKRLTAKQRQYSSDEMIHVLLQYVKLLEDELTEVAPIAATQGWKSTRFKQGMDLREKMFKVGNELRGLAT